MAQIGLGLQPMNKPTVWRKTRELYVKKASPRTNLSISCMSISFSPYRFNWDLCSSRREMISSIHVCILILVYNELMSPLQKYFPASCSGFSSDRLSRCWKISLRWHGMNRRFIKDCRSLNIIPCFSSFGIFAYNLFNFSTSLLIPLSLIVLGSLSLHNYFFLVHPISSYFPLYH